MKSKTRAQRTKTRADLKKRVSTAKKAAPGEFKGFSIPIYNVKGKEVGTFDFNKKIFDGEVNKKILYQAILMYNSNKRQGNAATKTRGDVSGGGKKPFRQKGTGRARAGSTRSPLWRHGGTVFGPHPRDFHYSIPKQMKRLAFLSIINSKLNDNKVIGIDSLVLEEAKTKKFKGIMDALKLQGKSLFILDAVDEKIMRASRNLQEADIKNYRDFSTLDVLKCDTVVMTKTALEKLPERFKN
ncbi:MAG: 50S ribosomal protein L4 [Candidatus Omnitrophota bacterium]|nr:50S ribosomal protein L4 [Candidatus Omnitrophota bacterium]